MRTDDDLRRLYCSVLLRKKFSWVESDVLEEMVRMVLDGITESALENMERLGMPAGARSYLDELDATPSDELLRLASLVSSENTRAREQADYNARQEKERAAKQDRASTMFMRWARKAYWKPHEAVLLALGVDPGEDVGSMSRGTEFHDLTDLLARAIESKRLNRDISPRLFLEWLLELQLVPPSGLVSAIETLFPIAPFSESSVLPASSLAIDVEGYECPPELVVMVEAIKTFWVNADRSRPPKKNEIFEWIRTRVDSDFKATAIDSLIRPVWARVGGNKPLAKG